MSSLVARLTLRFALLVTGAGAAVLALGGWLLDRQITRGLLQLHEVEARELGELLGAEAGISRDEISRRIQHDSDLDATLFVVQVTDGRGTVVFRSSNLGEFILPAAAAGAHREERVPVVGRVLVSAAQEGPWLVQVGSRLAPGEAVIREYIRISAGLVVLAAAVGSTLGYVLSRQAVDPLRAIEAAARRFGVENLGGRVPVPPGPDEVVSLARLLNESFDRLQVSFEQVRRFSGDVSHELKTPLALARLNAEKLRGRLVADDEAGSALDEVLEELERIRQVIDRLLFLAKAEGGALAPACQATPIDRLIVEVAQDARVIAEERGVNFQLGRNEAAMLQVDPGLIRQLLLNLLTNALSVTPAAGTVALASWPEGGEWVLAVTDEGPGLSAEQRARMFGRFVRFGAQNDGGAARGHGLGLAISKSIVELHRGSIHAEPRQDRPGLVLVVKLPGKRPL
jgi:two-component system heavy metal sensor histidine kinase CusS